MRRGDREINDNSQIQDIVKRCKVVNVAFNDGEYPYIVPLNFGYFNENLNNILYFHSATSGKKINAISNSCKVAFSMYTNTELQINDDIACKSTMRFESVCGVGEISVVGGDEALLGLKCLMLQYTDKECEFTKDMVKQITILKLKIAEWTAKSSIM